MDDNPLYEERRNLDRQAGLSVIQETERRLKRKQYEKQKEDRDEKIAKVSKKEEPKGSKDLGEGDNNNESSHINEESTSQKFGINRKLKKDYKEAEKKEGKKEESQKESKQSFGKFSWKKNEKDERNQSKDESAEEGKDKESKSQSGKSNSKPIAIKLSGRTVIPHTSPWTPVVSTSSQAKIRPNLPGPVMVLRKNATTTVSKPAPLNTFLSIKSSGATTKPLPVVKEGNPELVLPPDIISKAFRGEVVVLKGSQEDSKVPEQAEELEQETVARAIEHAKALEQAKASAAKAQEQAMIVAKAQAKARELATLAKEQEITRQARMNERILDRSHRRPLLPLPPGLLPPHLPLPTPVLYPSPPVLLPPNPLSIPAEDDLAPGVSEDDKNILAMPMCPRPLPPPTIFRDQAKKLEKKNTSLAAGNAKDLYDIFYNSGRNPAENKPANSLDKERLNSTERETTNIGMLTDFKQNNNSSSQEHMQNVDSSSDVSKIPLGDGAPETEVVKVEKILTTCEENIEIASDVEGGSDISLPDAHSTFKCGEASKCLPANASVSFQNLVTGTPPVAEFSNNPSELESPVLTLQLSESSSSPLDDISKKPSELQGADFKSSNDKESTIQLSEDNVASLEDLTRKSSELEAVELAIQLPESSSPLLGEICKKAPEFETTDFKSSDDKEVAIQLSEDNVTSLEDLTKKSSQLESIVTLQLPEDSAPPLNEISKKPSDLETAELAFQLPENSGPPLDEVSMKSLGLETAELATPLLGGSAPLLGEICKTTSESKSSCNKEVAIKLSDNVASSEDLSKKSSELEEIELAVQLPESGTGLSGEICKKSLELETEEFKSPDDKMLEMELPGRETDFSKEFVGVRDVDMTSEDISQPQDQQEVEVHDGSKLKEIKSDLETKTYMMRGLGERYVEREHLELAGHQFAVSQGDPESQLFEMQIDAHEEKGPTLTEEKPSNDNSELPVSTWASKMYVQSHLAWEPIDSSKVNEENPQVMMTDSKKSQLNLKLGGIGGLESAISNKNPPASEVQNMEPELKPLNKGQCDSFHTNNEDKELLGNSQPKDGEDFNVSNLGEIQDVCLVNVTMISSSSSEKHEEICQQSSNCKAKNFPVQGTEDLGSISSTDGVEPSSRVQEPVDSLSTEFSTGHLEEEALVYTGINTGVLNASTAGDFELNSTYSELNFDQSATLTLNLNVENERDSTKSDDVKLSGPSMLKPGLELESIDFSLGDIEVEREPLGILPSEILNEDTVDSPKLEIIPISLESSKTSELAIDQPGAEPEIDFVALTAGDQEGKLCSLVSDVVAPASDSCTAETGMPCLKTQDMPPVSQAPLQADSSKGGTPDVL